MLFCSITTGALGSSGLLQSCSIITKSNIIAQHHTHNDINVFLHLHFCIYTSTSIHLQFCNAHRYKPTFSPGSVSSVDVTDEQLIVPAAVPESVMTARILEAMGGNAVGVAGA